MTVVIKIMICGSRSRLLRTGNGMQLVWALRNLTFPNTSGCHGHSMGMASPLPLQAGIPARLQEFTLEL